MEGLVPSIFFGGFMSDKKVKVKILKHVGAWTPGEVVEVTEEFAKHLCHVNVTTDGLTETRHVRALMLDEAEALELANMDISNLTAAEAKELGVKNIVDSSPKSEEAQLADAAAKMQAEAEAEIAAEEAAAKKGKGKK